MKITVYTTADCQFSKQEKEYLASNNLQYEEKNLEANKDFLTEMLAVSNNFAGTPVTRIEKDDGTIVVLKGFTKEEFDAALGFTQTSPTPPTTQIQEELTKPAETPTPETTPSDQSTSTTATPQVEIPIQPASTDSSGSTPPMDEKLGSVLDKLEEKTEVPTIPTETAPSSTETPAAAPTTPPVADAPTIPDFSADSASQSVK